MHGRFRQRERLPDGLRVALFNPLRPALEREPSDRVVLHDGPKVERNESEKKSQARAIRQVKKVRTRDDIVKR
jgi:hypothetical protein